MHRPQVPALVALACAAAGGSASAQFSFLRTDFAVGPQPDAAVAADLDGDFDLDLAVTNDAPDKVSILRNNGNGTFAAPVHVFLGGGTAPHTPVAGDLDGDGDVDLAVSLKNTNSVQILVNTAGVFAAGPIFPVGAEPRNMEIGDMDNDLDLDLVVANRTGNTVSVLRNGGGLAFTVASYAAGLEPREIAIGDVTGDGLLDVAVAAHDSDAILVLRGTGAAALTLHATLPTPPRSPTGVAIARLNADLLLDVAATADNNNVEFAIVFLNLGAGAFGAGAAYANPGLNSSSMRAGDFDVDGDMDLAIANQDSSNLSVLPNSGGGVFGAAQLFAVGANPTHVTAGDLDGNGGADLVTTNETGGNVSVLLNGVGSFASFCFGDGSGTACPCGNASAAGSGAGCLNSFGMGALLGASGSARLSNDTVVLAGSGMPNAPSLYFQGTARENAGLGTVFGDGLRCASGTVVRLKQVTNAGGASQYPQAGDPPVSVRGLVAAPGTRTYQVWYRNTAAFCTADGWNLSNGVQVAWAL